MALRSAASALLAECILSLRQPCSAGAWRASSTCASHALVAAEQLPASLDKRYGYTEQKQQGLEEQWLAGPAPADHAGRVRGEQSGAPPLSPLPSCQQLPQLCGEPKNKVCVCVCVGKTMHHAVNHAQTLRCSCAAPNQPRPAQPPLPPTLAVGAST